MCELREFELTLGEMLLALTIGGELYPSYVSSLRLQLAFHCNDVF